MHKIEAETGLYTRKTLIGLFVLTCIVTTGVVAWFAPAHFSYARIVAGGISLGALAYLSTMVNHLIIAPLPDDPPAPEAPPSSS